jgi:hypothetical protein
VEVRAIRKILLQKVATYENMSPEKIAEILWSIFVDARSYFSELANGDVLPSSMLTFTRHWLKSGSIKTTEGCPINRLLGINPGYVPQVQHAPAERWENPFEPAQPPSAKGPRINPNPVAILVAAIKPIVQKHARLQLKKSWRPRIRLPPTGQ